MAAKKGHAKVGGRQPGTPNRTTKEVRRWLFEVLHENMSTLETDLQELAPKERWQIINGLLPYIVSKRQEGSNRSYTFDFPDKDPDDFETWDDDLAKKYL